MTNDNRNQLLSALVYLAGEQGVKPEQVKQVYDLPIAEARKICQSFSDWFNALNLGIMVQSFNDVYRFVTRPEHFEQISKLVTHEKKQKLSQAALETIGIVAYRQPVTRSQINEIRGIASEAVVNTLLTKGLIEEQGISQKTRQPDFVRNHREVLHLFPN
ncbi:SMC-Scp complex subunit ScpB [Mycoplasma sp. ATU-Cv-508]|uniref:SMC-Scp complex subunit ScpB n=1 Tax=Mycoplasma sp. ATU-Cv-508 TaxID=2048001 RepID=UPI0031F2EF60